MGPIHPDEMVTRYILQKNQYSTKDMIVRTGAFIPYEGATSVFRISDLSENKIWEIGIQKIEAKRADGRSLKARGDISVNKIYKVKLNIVPETSLHERHADIIGWPDNLPEQQLIASELAIKAKLQLKP